MLLAALALLLAACGDDTDEVVAGSSGGDPQEQSDGEATDDEVVEDGAMDDEAMDDEAMDDEADHSDDGLSDADLVQTESHPELISAQKAPISDVVTIDEQTLGVRYQAGAEPCSLANVTLTETDTSVTVLLETGLHPNAAAMSCIAQVFDYEIQVPLEQPLGEREIVLDTP